jgi:hypothetical protein
MGELLEAANPFAAVLAPGETLLWSGAPTAGGLFLANVAGILGSLIWAALAAAGFGYAIVERQEAGFAACGIFVLVALYSLYRSVRDALGGRHVRYAITPQRILSIDDRDEAPFIVQRNYPQDSLREAWLDGRAKRGWRRGGRATVKIPYTQFQLGTPRIPDGYQKNWLRFVAVEGADEAVALLNGARAR